MYCKQCGSQVGEDAIFCNQCGTHKSGNSIKESGNADKTSYKNSKEVKMEYMIEPIGTHFRSRDIQALVKRFNNNSKEGFRFHSVFEASQPSGCLGFGGPITTLFAVYEKEV